MLWKTRFTGRDSSVIRCVQCVLCKFWQFENCCESRRLREATAVLWKRRFTGGHSSVIRCVQCVLCKFWQFEKCLSCLLINLKTKKGCYKQGYIFSNFCINLTIWEVLKLSLITWRQKKVCRCCYTGKYVGGRNVWVAWPSGLRRWFKAPVSSEAWVRIPPLPRDRF